ncbi:oxidase [Pseudomonas sp. RP23018S]|uniref:oxidase n=1 Tax=Pseudomonas sp. RP23018S TaxID=3096037 RepID=UPI002ACACF43|nr:oxidase [Pseudomonas sp. RP23018S]MDZ5601412.1 oxidase [Pseudomonas sp. RP23018S]
MSILSVFHCTRPQQPNKVLTHATDIATTLAEHGVQLSQVELTGQPRPGCGQPGVLQALGSQLEALSSAHGCSAVSVIDCDGSSEVLTLPSGEHAYDTPETFVIVSGRAQVSVRRGDWVLAVLCERGDVLQVPSGSGRWLSLGDHPFCVALRLRAGKGESIPVVSEHAGPSEFPGMDEL